MADERRVTRLFVKFAWKKSRLRGCGGPEPNLVENLSQPESLSRSAQYIRKLKSDHSDRYEERLRRDRERKKSKYVNVVDRAEASLESQREKWRLQKRKQRYSALQATNPTTSDTQSVTLKSTTTQSGNIDRKSLKKMTITERKEYNRVKQQESRARKSRQAIQTDRSKNTQQRREARASVRSQNDGSDATVCDNAPGTSDSSRSTRYRKLDSIKKQMPTSPRSYAAIVENLVTSVTPKRRSAVERKILKCGTGRRNLDQALSRSMENEMKKIIASGTVKKEHRPAFCALVRLGVAGKLTRKDLAICGISHTTAWRAKKRLLEVVRKKRKDALSDDTIDTVTNFWYESSREMPLKKRVKKGRPLYLLDCNYTQLFKQFRRVHADVKIGYCSFVKQKPPNVRMMKPYERAVCCCSKCEVVKLLLLALNVSLPEDARHLKIGNLPDISNISMCKYDSLFPDPKCIDRKCDKCGPKLIKEHYKALIELMGTTEISYDTWETVSELKEVRDGKGGKVKKISTHVTSITKKATIKEVVELLAKKMEKFSGHLFRAKWQQHQMRLLKDVLPAKTAIVIIDYAQNYGCSLQDEVQSYHWAQGQVTVHPAVAFINDTDEEGRWVKKETIVSVTDDTKHDAAAVLCFMKKTYSILREKYAIKKVFEFSDCCAGQYRGKESFANMTFAHNDFKIEVEHHYFESSHGKSSADGDSAVVKHGVTKAVTNRQAIIRNATEFFNYCTAHLSTVAQNSVFRSEAAKYKNSKRCFVLIEPSEIVRQDEERKVETLKGTMTIHATKNFKQPYKIGTRLLSCFCDLCRNGTGGGACDSVKYSGEWRDVHLKPSKLKYAATSEDDVYETCEDESNLDEVREISVGTFVAVGLKGRKKQGLNMYVGRIDEHDESEQMAKIQFLKKGDANCFSIKEGDISWESVESNMAPLKAPKVLPRAQFIFDEQSLTIAALIAGATTPIKFN